MMLDSAIYLFLHRDSMVCLPWTPVSAGVDDASTVCSLWLDTRDAESPES